MAEAPELSFEVIQQKIRKIGSLPTLPTMASDVMGMAQDDQITMADIAAKIDGDPSISAKLLRIANSSFYGLPRSVTTTTGAILVIGLKEVQNIILSISVFSAFGESKENALFDRGRFWTHCSAVGSLSRMLAQKLGLSFEGEEYCGGVLHDIGKIVLDEFFHDQFNEVLKRAKNENIPVLQIEKQILGTTHPEIGGWMLNYWKLPMSLARVAAFHHHPMGAKGDFGLVGINSIANDMAKSFGYGVDKDIQEMNISEHPGWELLLREYPVLEKKDPIEIHEEMRDDFEEAQRLGEINLAQV